MEVGNIIVTYDMTRSRHLDRVFGQARRNREGLVSRLGVTPPFQIVRVVPADKNIVRYIEVF